MRILLAATILHLLLTSAADAAFFRRSRAIYHPSGVTLRKRLNVNDLIADPGTVEVDFGSLYSYTTSSFTLPSALKFTPGGDSLLIGRTEYSISFDSLASVPTDGNRVNQFSDHLTFAATSIIYDSAHFDVAVAPQITTLLRNASGVRLGATVIARYDGGGNSLGVAASWSAATAASDTNPAGIWDLGAGYGRHLARTGLLARFTPHANALLEKSTGYDRTVSVFGGLAYQFNEHVSLDVSGQRFSLIGPNPDRQLLVSLTVNFGKKH